MRKIKMRKIKMRKIKALYKTQERERLPPASAAAPAPSYLCGCTILKGKRGR